jgi:sugar lactone lactonase YvrE
VVDELRAELVLDARAELGEGPVWDDAAGTLWWVDIDGRAVHRFDPGSGHDTAIPTPSKVGAVALRTGGGLAVALANGIRTLESRAVAAAPDVPPDAWLELVTFDQPADVRSNDAKCDPAGRLIVGTYAADERRVGALYAVDGEGRVQRLLDGLAIANGMAWSGDGATFSFIDSPDRRVDDWDYDLASGKIARRRTRVAFDPHAPAMPDGMTIDAEGGLWVAFWGGWDVRRIAPDGSVDAVVAVPAAQVTSCAFGGPDLRDLYITTAATGLAGDALRRQPHAGGLFRVRPGVAGLAPDRFVG